MVDPTSSRVDAELGPSGASFTENAGQLRNENVRFYLSTDDIQVGFATSSVLFRIMEPLPLLPATNTKKADDSHEPLPVQEKQQGALVRLTFEGTNLVEPKGIDELPHRSHFFLGNDPSKWRTNVRSFRTVVYQGLYDGIDLVYALADGDLKYEFRLARGANPGAIQATFEGVTYLIVDAESLVVHTPLGELRDTAPLAFQDGGRNVVCDFELRSLTTYGFACEGLDSSKPLVIDPLVYATFLGGSTNDTGLDVMVDAVGNAYAMGETESLDFPVTPGAFSTSLAGVGDSYVAKFDPMGGLVFATYLGGTMETLGDVATSLQLDSSGDILVAGYTNATDFPVTPGALNTSFHYSVPCLGLFSTCTDGFVVKISADGSVLRWATYLGGTDSELIEDIEVDAVGRVLLAGYTWSRNFPTSPGAFDTIHGENHDVFVTKLSADGSTLVWSTFLGDTTPGMGHADRAQGIALGADGTVFVVGETYSPDFPVTPGAYDTNRNGSTDVFVAKLSANGSTLIWSTFIGGGGQEYGRSFALDVDGNAYVTGYTDSPDYPVTLGAFDMTMNGSWDAFVTKLSADGTSLIWSTFLGGRDLDAGTAIRVDRFGTAYVVGNTNSSDFPVPPWGLDTALNGSWDAFFVRMNADGTGIIGGTFLGGSDWESGRGVAVGADDAVVLVGNTNSSDFPVTPGAFDSILNERDAFLVKLDMGAADLAVSSADITFLPPSPVYANDSVVLQATVHNIGTWNATDVRVRFHDGPPSGSNQIGTDQVLPLVVPSGSDIASVNWTAGSPGLHDICVDVDPEDMIPETNESNNDACALITVLPPPEFRPDYVPIQPVPSSPVRTGLSMPLSLSILVRNDGNDTAKANATLAFSDEFLPPFATFMVTPITPSNVSARFTADWVSPATPGTYNVTADVDYLDDIFEWNETNNVYTWTIDVVEGPLTSLLIGDPNYTSTVTYVKSSTPLDLSVVDQGGSGINHTWFRVDNVTWTEYSSSFFLTGEGEHYVEWYSEDNAGNMEDVQVAVLRVDDTPPRTNANVGDPKVVAVDTFVTSSTLITFTATDGGLTPVGLDFIEYHIDGGTWNPYTSPFTLQGEGAHNISYRSVDLLGNWEVINPLAVIVDDTPPTTSHEIGTPVRVAADTYVTSNTDITLASTDGGLTPVGLDVVEYQVDGGGWLAYSSGFTLTGADGPRTIEYRSRDLLGNSESIKNFTVVLDDTPPATTFEPATGPYSLDTVFTLTATDGGSGVNVTRYRIDGGVWTTYSGSFTLTEGTHNVSFYSIDMLDNTEAERWREVTISGEPPPEAEANYKPVVAVIFAIILLIAGLWSSRRRPWKGGEDGMAVAKAFLIISMPFVLIEVATGILSLSFESLRIPPLIGIGTFVDCSILAFSILLMIARLIRKHENGIKTSSN